MSFAALCRRVAAAAADSSGAVDDIRTRLRAFARDPRERWWIHLAVRPAVAFPPAGRPAASRLRARLLDDAGFADAHARWAPRLSRPLPPPAPRAAVGVIAGWGLPELSTPADLARLLGEDIGALRWLAGGWPREPDAPGRGSPWRFVWRPKRDGRRRLIAQPKPRLKAAQRRLLAAITERMPPHAAAHGFVRGRSIRGFAAPHADRHVVLRLDLADFFPSVRGARVLGLLRAAGYPERVARLIAGLCCVRAPSAVLHGCAPQERVLYRGWHLPQGAPTSPALANACAWRLDRRLHGLARSLGARYTRYADDLAFSGNRNLATNADILLVRIEAIVLAEGFRLRRAKTRVMRRSQRQHLAGLVVNRSPGLPRRERELTEAILHNCVRLGPAGQNREQRPDFRAHLAGRVAWIAQHHAALGERLRALLARIDWSR